MGNIMVNYYRKMDAKDGTVPQVRFSLRGWHGVSMFEQEPLGEPFILDVNDESPFMKFGSIQPGQTIPTLYNNLVRAPLFRHRAEHTDFLVVKSVISALDPGRR